jgi:hypothetical protein
MMSQAARDPVFFAALDIANVDAAYSGDLCLRCHAPRGWYAGRTDPPDGSQLTEEDLEGVQCEVCHRMVDPVFSPENPDRDQTVILPGITATVNLTGNAALIIDPEDYRRGPFDIVADLGFDIHTSVGADGSLLSPYHQEAAFCGSCHNIDNPLLSWNEDSQSYLINPLDTPADVDQLFPIERTFSEWELSEFNSVQGVYAPEFGGNKEFVSTCQDCHMRDVTGKGGTVFGNLTEVPERSDMPMHDLTGANTWVPQIIPLHPAYSNTFNVVDPQRKEALISGTLRSRSMLQNAAEMDVFYVGNNLSVWVTNNAGHKLPTGYVEGRRMWIQVEGYDISNTLIYTSGAYDLASGDLFGYQTDPSLQVYESHQGLTPDWAAQLGLPPGPSFHFILNNAIVSDNRIPPRGYNFAAFNNAGAAPHNNGQPDPTMYVDGQYWDVTHYGLPTEVISGTVRLLFQVASKEYIEFLRDNNPFPGLNNGELLYDLWTQTERSRPEVMVEMNFIPSQPDVFLPTVPRKP